MYGPVWVFGSSDRVLHFQSQSPLEKSKTAPSFQMVVLVVYHLHKDSSISEWKINGTHIFGRPNRKITGINGLLEKV